MKKWQQIVLCMILGAGLLRAGDLERGVLSRTTPEYPEIALKMNLHGTVKLKIWIRPDGSVSRLEYVGGHPLLAESALKAVKVWKFEAAPKDSTQQVEVKF